MHRVAIVFCLLALAVVAPLRAQVAEGLAPSAAVAQAPAASPPPAVGATDLAAQGPAFAERAQQARTMQAYWHVFIAFAVTLLLLFGYAISLGRRWADLERQVLAIRQENGAG